MSKARFGQTRCSLQGELRTPVLVYLIRTASPAKVQSTSRVVDTVRGFDVVLQEIAQSTHRLFNIHSPTTVLVRTALVDIVCVRGPVCRHSKMYWCPRKWPEI